MVYKVFFFFCLFSVSLQGEDKLAEKKRSQQIRPESSALEDSTIKYIEAEIPKLKGKEKISKIQELRNVIFTKFLKEEYKLGYNAKFASFWRQSKGQIFATPKEFDILNLPKLDNQSPEEVVAQYYKTKFFGDLESYKKTIDPLYRPLIKNKLDHRTKIHSTKLKLYAQMQIETSSCKYVFIAYSVLRSYDSALQEGEISKGIYVNSLLLRKENNSKEWFVTGDSIDSNIVSSEGNFIPTRYKYEYMMKLNDSDEYKSELDGLIKKSQNPVYSELLKNFKKESIFFDEK